MPPSSQHRLLPPLRFLACCRGELSGYLPLFESARHMVSTVFVGLGFGREVPPGTILGYVIDRGG